MTDQGPDGSPWPPSQSGQPDQPSFDRPDYGSGAGGAGYGSSPSYGPPPDQPGYGPQPTTPYSPPPATGPGYGGPPSYGQPSYGAPAYGQPAYPPSAYPPPTGPPGPPSGPPGYGGGPGFGGPGSSGPGDGAGGGPGKGVIIGIVGVIVIAVVAVVAFVLVGHDKGKSPVAGKSSFSFQPTSLGSADFPSSRATDSSVPTGSSVPTDGGFPTDSSVPTDSGFPTDSAGPTDSTGGSIDLSAAKAVVAQYISDINSQDDTDAAALICSSSLTAWKKAIRGPGGDFTVKVQDATLTGSTPSGGGLDLSYTLQVTSVSTGATGTSKVTFAMVNDNGVKICGDA